MAKNSGKFDADNSPTEGSGEDKPAVTEQDVPQQEARKAGFDTTVDRGASDPHVPSAVYTGMGGVKTITEEQWVAAGITDQKGVRWDNSNEFSVPLDDLSESAVARLRSEPGFKIQN